jgi:hypothetical protein
MDNEHGPEREETWLHSLAALPRPALTAERHAEMRAAMHRAQDEKDVYARAGSRWFTLLERRGEPALLALSAGAVLVRLASVLALYFGR